MRLLLVFGIVGQLLRLFSMAFVPPLLFAIAELEWAEAGYFAIALVATLAFGVLFGRVPTEVRTLYRSEALGVVAYTWLFIGMFGAIPYMLHGLGFVDALFESISGFTTTGATILTDFGEYGRPFFLWRSMTQWFGGLGVIALFVVVLPRLGIAGRQLFFAEASGAPGEAVSPQARSSARRLWILYSGLTALLVVLLAAAGMDPFNALCHALTTLAAGGFSPNPASIAGFDNAAVEWILIVFMTLAGTSFPLIYVVMTRRPLAFFRDGEFMLYLSVTLLGGLAMALAIHGPADAFAAVASGHFEDFEDALRKGLFQSASVISSTGFASTDYNLWPDTARVLILFVMVVGGCAGSAAGGPKVVRHLLVAKHVATEMKRVLHPRAVLTLKYKGQPVAESIMRAVFTLVVLYVGGYFVFGTILVLLGEDLVTAFSAAIACLGNVGPAFGEAGPMGNFAGFSSAGKLVLTFAMWIGRLEIVTVLALLHPHVFRNTILAMRRSVL